MFLLAGAALLRHSRRARRAGTEPEGPGAAARRNAFVGTGTGPRPRARTGARTGPFTRVCHHRAVDYPNDQAPGAPIRSGIPEHGRIPKYYALKARIAVLLDELGEGGLLPTERELAQLHEVSRETVRQALRELLLEGRLRRQGRGTVVAGPKLEQPLSLASYTEGVRRQGRRPGRNLIGLDRFPCPKRSPPRSASSGASRSGTWSGCCSPTTNASAWRARTSVSPASPTWERRSTRTLSFYAYLRDALGISFGDADERIETVLATPREALLIGTPPALPMLLIHRLSRDADGRPLERVRTLFRGDRFSFSAHLRGEGQG